MKNAKDLTQKQKRFVDEYVIDFNATQAAIRAGYSAKTAYVIGAENLKKPKIHSLVQERLDEQSARAVVKVEKILDEEKCLAYADPRKIVDPKTGAPLPLHQIPEEVARSIASVEIKEFTDEKGNVKQRLYKYRLWDKGRSLERLGRHKGMYIDRQRLEMEEGVNYILKILNDVCPEKLWEIQQRIDRDLFDDN